MKILFKLFVLLLFLSGLVGGQQKSTAFPKLTGPYFGQTPPGTVAEVFAKDLISVTGRYEYGVSFSPDGRELLVGTQDSDSAYLVYSKETAAGWSEPKRISLTQGKFKNEMEAFFTPDGKSIYLAPFNNPNDLRLWKVERSPQGWAHPGPLDPAVSSFPAFYPVCAANQTLYFFNIQERKICRATSRNGKYTASEVAGIPLGVHCFIAPDESFALIDGRIVENGKMDIYVVLKNAQGQWLEPQNLGAGVNTEFGETCPALSQDGKYIFFSRYNEAKEISDIYWVDAKIIEALKAKN